MALLAAKIHPGMPVLGSDARVLGRVAGADRRHIRLDGAPPRRLPLTSIAAVDGRQVTLLMPAAEAPVSEG